MPLFLAEIMLGRHTVTPQRSVICMAAPHHLHAHGTLVCVVEEVEVNLTLLLQVIG